MFDLQFIKGSQAHGLPAMIDVDSLYAVQKEALTRASGKRSFAQFMDMGTGKTRVTLVEAALLIQEKEIQHVVIVCPRSLRGSWEDEATAIKFPYPVILLGDKLSKTQKAVKDAKGPCVVIMHYELILTRGGEMIEWLMGQGAVYIALDESTRIKNPQSKVLKKLVQITRPRPETYKRVLSGGPAPQGPHDLWGQFHFIGVPGLKPYYSFRNTFCKLGGWMGKQVKGAQNLDILRKQTGEWVFRAKKKDWTDLPEKLPAITREVEMLPNQKAAYLSMMHHFVMEWGDRNVTAQMAVTAKGKLAQISTGFVFDDDGEIHWLMDFKDNPKLKELEDIIDQVDTKLIVFYHHKAAKQALEWLANKHDNQYKSVFLESGLTDAEITSRKHQFNNLDEVKVIYCQSSSHKYGHTLLGTKDQPCHTSVFFENTYNRETRGQSEDRNHRHGQVWPVTYLDIATSREDKLTIKSLQNKEALEDSIMLEFGRTTGANINYMS
jgi:SNF2 family DNA or RNA helicase